MTKAFGAVSIASGSSTSLTFTVSNPANNPALTNVNFVDTLPSNLKIFNTTVAGSCSNAVAATTVAANGPTATIANLNIAAGGAGGSVCTVTVNITNVTGLTGTCPDVNFTNAAANIISSSNVTNGVVSSCLAVSNTPTVAKTLLPANIAQGGISQLTITLGNTNASLATLTSALSDTLPAGVTVATPNGLGGTCMGGVTAVVGSGTVTYNNGGTIPINGSCTILVNVTSSTTGTVTNTIAVGALQTSNGSNAAATSAPLTVNGTPTLTKTWSTFTIADGGNTSLIFTLTNSGTNPAQSGIAFTESLPASLRFNSATPTVTFGAGCSGTSSVTLGAPDTIALSAVAMTNATASCTITVVAVTNRAGASNASCAASPAAFTNSTTNITGTTNVSNGVTAQCVVVIAPDLNLSKTSASTFVVGSPANFVLTPRNTLGTAPTMGTVTVTDALPTGLTYVPAGSGGTGWSCANAGQTVTCTSSTVINAGAIGNPITINVAVGSSTVPGVTNTATVAGGGEPAANTGNNSATLSVPVGNMAVNTFLTDGAQTGVPGSSVLYTHVFNAGLAGAVGFSTADTPSPAIAGWATQIYRDTNCNGVLDPTEGISVLSGSVTVNPGDQVCVVIRSNIPAAAPFNAQDIITVTATFTPTVGPAVPYTRQDVTTVGAVGGSGLTLTKSVRNITQGGAEGTANTARPGDVLEYVVTYTNTASTAVMTVVISDNTPAFTNFNVASCGAPLPAALTSCSITTQPMVGAGGNIQWTLGGSLNAGQTGTVTFRVTVQ